MTEAREFTLCLPLAPSVNRTRKINWANYRKVEKWKEEALKSLLVAWSGGKRPKPMLGKYEVHITLAETTRIDGDNAIKSVIDLVRALNLVVDDSPKYLRRIVVDFGEIECGCRVVVREWQ
ncbi:MAG: hypothetical protein KGL39_06235 [Patescibacteria group bacterium]|nr:hypothetical protein [Patescibacteria group bacterium]